MFAAEAGKSSEVVITGEDVVVEDEVFVGAPSEVGITDGMVRLSIGLEHIEDIKDDLNQALAKL